MNDVHPGLYYDRIVLELINRFNVKNKIFTKTI